MFFFLGLGRGAGRGGDWLQLRLRCLPTLESLIRHLGARNVPRNISRAKKQINPMENKATKGHIMFLGRGGASPWKGKLASIWTIWMKTKENIRNTMKKTKKSVFECFSGYSLWPLKGYSLWPIKGYSLWPLKRYSIWLPNRYSL